MAPHRPDEGEAVQCAQPHWRSVEVGAGGEIGRGLDPAHQGAAVKRALEVQLAGAHRLDLVHVRDMRAPRLERDAAADRQWQRAREQLEQLACKESLLAAGGGRRRGQLPGSQLGAELAPQVAFPEPRYLARSLRTQLRDDRGPSLRIQRDEGHVSLERALLGGGRPVPHRDRHPQRARRGVPDRGGHGDSLADPDGVEQLQAVHRRGRDRTPAVAARRQHADHVHPLENLPGAEEALLVRDVGSDPLVEVRFRPWAALLRLRSRLAACVRILGWHGQ